MIGEPLIDRDAAGFPVVAWEETRSVLAPGGPGIVRVECRVTKDAAGVLFFTVRGKAGNGGFERGKELAKLTGFSKHAADGLYDEASDRVGRDLLAGKSQAARAALKSQAQVVFAEFGGAEPIHVNYAEASGHEFERLEVALVQAFGPHRMLAAKLCPVMYRWPVHDDRVATFEPSRRGWNAPPLRKQILPWAVAICVAVLIGFGLLRLIGSV